MKIKLEQVKTVMRSSPPPFPDEYEMYVDDGTNTKSRTPGWRIYINGTWHDIGLQEADDIAIDGGTF